MLITAWMYFIFTLLLLAQHIYYTHSTEHKQQHAKQVAASEGEGLLAGDSGDDDPVGDLHGPLLHTHRHRQTRLARLPPETHRVYGSLRNLSIRQASSSSSLSFSDTGRRLHDSFVHRVPRHRGLPPAVLAGPDRPPTADAATVKSLRSAGLAKSSTGAPTAGKMLAGVVFLALAAIGSSTAGGFGSSRRRRGDRVGATTMPADGEFLGMSCAMWGAVMGWIMAVTFFLGRVPQVIKNWRRQSCAGLSVEMFLMVLSAAVTYCASILIRARSWSDLAPKLPFLADAAVGALLDLAILAQFLMYRNADGDDGNDGDTPSPAASVTGSTSEDHGSKSLHAGVSTGGKLNSGSNTVVSDNTGLAGVPAGRLPVLSSLRLAQQAAAEADTVHGQCDCCDTSVAMGHDVCAGVVAGAWDPVDADHQGAHVNILVIDHHDQGVPEVTLSTSWNEDALSLSSAATV